MGAVRPILVSIPEALTGPRVHLRPFTDGDAETLYTAIQESLEHLRPWLPWWNSHESIADTREFVRRSQAQWLLREAFTMGLFTREGGALLGGIGLHPQDWQVPCFEIGYWLRRSAEGQGYMSEATWVLTAFAFDSLGAERVIIRCDVRNARSAAVPRRLGYTREALLRHAGRDTAGELEDMLVYAMIPDDYARARPAWSAGQLRKGDKER